LFERVGAASTGRARTASGFIENQSRDGEKRLAHPQRSAHPQAQQLKSLQATSNCFICSMRACSAPGLLKNYHLKQQETSYIIARSFLTLSQVEESARLWLTFHNTIRYGRDSELMPPEIQALSASQACA